MQSQVDITKGFIQKAKNITTSFQWAWPNVKYEPNSDHLRLFVLPVRPTSTSLGCDTWAGVIQISVYVKEGFGIISALEEVDKIMAEFPRKSIFIEGQTRIQIVNDPYASPHFTSGAWCQIPVSINYEAT